jgi:hypothetical protein
MKHHIAGISTVFNGRRISALLQAAVLVAAGMLPLLVTQSASAAQLTSRSVAIDKSSVGSTAQGQNVQYDFDFTMGANTVVQGIVFEFCDAPLGVCNLPTGMNVNRTLTTLDSTAGLDTTGGSWAEFTTDDTGDCDDIDGSSDDTMYCISLGTAATTTAGALAVDLGAITNPTSVSTVYVRITLYSDDDFAAGDLVHNGTVAAAIVDQLTINGRVQERLNFCVAAMDEDDVEPVSVAACTALSDSNVDLGVIDDSTVAVSPVEPTATNGSDDDFGILMVNTNASGGVVVGYYPEDTSSVSGGDADQLKSFRVVPTNCDASGASVTDQCFVSAGNAGDGDVITQGTEFFGVYVPCVYDSANNPSATTANLNVANDSYNGSDSTVTGGTNACEGEAFASGTAEIGWNASASADTLVSSTNVVDDEIVKLRFAATASSTTPTGSYTVVTTYIATGTF